jgi:hypothetical protein
MTLRLPAQIGHRTGTELYTSGKQGVNYSKRELIKGVCVFFHLLSMVPLG